ncbi:MAG: DUF177 domain-containing protein [Bdellovibrionales bacterium]|nr:DUF177 domain-containing protein [Bdellovibrionales bacterium]
MVIRFQMIPEDHPLQLSFVIPSEVMNASEGSKPSPYTFDAPIRCDVKLRKMDEDVWVQAQIRGTLCPDCDRCTKNYNYMIEKDTQFTCQSLRATNAIDDEDGDLYFFYGPELDLTPIIREIVLLDLPMQFICNESCQGLCGHCGTALDLEGGCQGCGQHAIFPQKIVHL